MQPGETGPGQRALVKFYVVVALVFLFQTLVGGAIAHYRADPGSFYGFQLATIFPSNLMRTWHLQSTIMWIATSYVAAALFLGRTLRRDEPHRLAVWMHLLFVAFVVVIVAVYSANGRASRNCSAAGGSGSATRAGNIWSSVASGNTCWR